MEGSDVELGLSKISFILGSDLELTPTVAGSEIPTQPPEMYKTLW